MANRKGLGVSKKYANGTIHENATGRFMIIDRFADEDDDNNVPILEFQWISGEKEGKVETNKEANMAASIHKFQTSRGRPTVVAEPQRIEHNVPFMDKIDSILHQLATNSAYLDTFKTHIRSMDARLDKMISMQEEHHKTIDHLTKQVDELMHRNELLKGLQETVHKLVDKL